MSNHTHASRPPYLVVAMLCALSAQACLIDTTSSQELTCEQEGARQGDRLCQGGVWIEDTLPSVGMDAGMDMPAPMPDLGERPDLADIDMPTPVDMPNPIDMPVTVDMPVPTDMSADMQCPAPDTAAECLARSVCDTRIDLGENACGERVEVVCDATCAQGTCVQSTCIACPTTVEDYCAVLSKQGGDLRVCGSWTTPALDGCPLPSGTELKCECEGRDMCDMTQGDTGTCQACVPLDRATLLAGLPAESCNKLQVDDGCGGTVDLDPVDTCEAFETCSPSSLTHLTQTVDTCQPQQAMTLPMPNPAPSAGSEFGISIAIDGDVMAIGAPFDTRGNIDSESCGSVYVYERDANTNTWSYQDQLVIGTSDCNSGSEEFGASIAVLGRRIAVGAPNDGSAGRVYLFADQNNDKSWGKTEEIDGAAQGARGGSHYGESVALMFDTSPTPIGNGSLHLAVGAPDDRRGGGGDDKEGVVYSYRARGDDGNDDGGDTSELFILESPDNQQDSNYGERVLFRETSGSSVRLVVSHPDFTISQSRTHGSVYRSDGTSSGTRVNLDNTSVGIGPVGNDEFGSSLASDGQWLAVGSSQYNLAAGDDAGIAVLISDTMPMALNSFVQASNAGADDGFGQSIAISYPWLIVGAPYEDGDGDAHDRTGAAYLYKHDGASWQAQHIWRATAQPNQTYTGWSAAMTPDWAFYGAPDEGNGRVYMIPLTP
jgi:hypothetical protein